MSVRITRHAKERAKERLDVAYKAQRTKLFNAMFRYGHSIDHFAGEFKEYLEHKKYRNKGNIGIKVYDSNIYIYRNKTIITVFPVPEKFLPVRENLRFYDKENEYLKLLYKYVKTDNIIFDVLVKDSQNVITGLCIDDYFENFGVGATEVKSRNDAIKTYLRRIGKLDENLKE